MPTSKPIQSRCCLVQDWPIFVTLRRKSLFGRKGSAKALLEFSSPIMRFLRGKFQLLGWILLVRLRTKCVFRIYPFLTGQLHCCIRPNWMTCDLLSWYVFLYSFSKNREDRKITASRIHASRIHWQSNGCSTRRLLKLICSDHKGKTPQF